MSKVCNPSTWKVESGISGVELQVRLSYIRLEWGKKNQKTQPLNTLLSCTITLFLSKDRMSKMKNGSFS